eukprot:scaffold456_cov368-Pavlova_lutheri.AAC.31
MQRFPQGRGWFAVASLPLGLAPLPSYLLPLPCDTTSWRAGLHGTLPLHKPSAHQLARHRDSVHHIHIRNPSPPDPRNPQDRCEAPPPGTPRCARDPGASAGAGAKIRTTRSTDRAPRGVQPPWCPVAWPCVHVPVHLPRTSLQPDGLVHNMDLHGNLWLKQEWEREEQDNVCKGGWNANGRACDDIYPHGQG